MNDESLKECCKDSFELHEAMGTVQFQLDPNSSDHSMAPESWTGSESESSTTSSWPTPAFPTNATAQACNSRPNTGYVAGIAVTSSLCGLATISLVLAVLYIQKLKSTQTRTKSPIPRPRLLPAAVIGYDPVQQLSASTPLPLTATSTRWPLLGSDAATKAEDTRGGHTQPSTVHMDKWTESHSVGSGGNFTLETPRSEAAVSDLTLTEYPEAQCI